ncbi:hypothetical protein PUR23_09900 [Methylorubrum populi]|jgi:ribosome modulation factor|uniref:Ribosome modulation factor n=2 Tax=Methylorubrum TaxID=2282523 RepID=B1Z834_METPB|nr:MULTISPECIES: Rmf/CrpP family protein [Methylorubrum]ACB79001.1 hypothetical protein Mpop_0823 [Methylorubrum populi BJ001]MBA8915513.1 ribosome modulation factor [Methylorubrum thiocyanatum]PZP71411.1 MAG: hypothetical protein DI590_06865 [Methylorubrum populi]QDI79670.1 hypothetical protein E8E01_04135 [Methylorubrum populi]GJE81439.1 hypothetical protein CJNNKLLH_2791 [Methylorubrum thiocyanatum]
MRETDPHRPPADPIAEGARARNQGRPRDACPYPLNSPERTEWLEGYDGIPADRAPDGPLDKG